MIKNNLIKIISFLSFMLASEALSQESFKYRYKAEGVILGEQVVNPNLAPLISDQTFPDGYTDGTPYSHQIIASDPDGGTLTYSILGDVPSGLSVNSSTGLISGNPSSGGRDFTITVNVSDGDKTSSKDFTFRVYENCEFGAVGSVCGSDGAIYVGSLSDGKRRYIAANDLVSVRYGINGIDTPSLYKDTSDIDGKGNTDFLTPTYDATNDGYRLGTAAMDCRDLGEQWYLPAIGEMHLVFTSGLSYAALNMPGSYYMSSTLSNSTTVRYKAKSNTASYYATGKDNSLLKIKCMRN